MTRDMSAIDYDLLARAAVREFFDQAGQAALADSRPAVERPRAERDEYALRLEMAQLRLDALLGDSTDKPRRLPLDD